MFIATFNYSVSFYTLHKWFLFLILGWKACARAVTDVQSVSGYSILTKSMFLHALIKRWNLYFCVLLLGQHILCGLNGMFQSDFGKTSVIKEMFSLSHMAFICKLNANHH